MATDENRRGHRKTVLARSGNQQHTRQGSRAQADRPFAVQIVVFGRVKPWARYATAAEADQAVAQLKRHGFHAEREAP
jgi:hypothetical protein